MNESNAETPRLPSWLIFLMALAIGVAVASNYYAQPLLYSITDDLRISMDSSGAIITVAQFSYAMGLIFIAPLGDKIENKTLILLLMVLTTVGLCLSAASNTLLILMIGTAISGAFSAVAQVIIPFAATLSDPSRRGRVVGTLMGGLLFGILLARLFSGTISAIADWRMAYWIAAIIMALITLLLALFLPRYKTNSTIKYSTLITSIIVLFKQEHVLRVRALLGGIAFALFSLLWTPLAFLLKASPYYYNDFFIGLFGLAGVAGVICAPIVGRFSDKGKGSLVTTTGLILLLFSWLPLAFAQYSLILLIIGVIVIDLAVQVTHISCMNAIFQIRPEARSRMNSGYMVSYFIGGMFGSIISTYLFSHLGWMSIVIASVVLALLGLIIWGIELRRIKNSALLPIGNV